MPTKENRLSKVHAVFIKANGDSVFMPLGNIIDEPVAIDMSSADEKMSELNNAITSLGTTMEMTAELLVTSSLYDYLYKVGFINAVPNNWLRLHGYPMRRRIRRR